jgi:hypothetical protein
MPFISVVCTDGNTSVINTDHIVEITSGHILLITGKKLSTGKLDVGTGADVIKIDTYYRQGLIDAVAKVSGHVATLAHTVAAALSDHADVVHAAGQEIIEALEPLTALVPQGNSAVGGAPHVLSWSEAVGHLPKATKADRRLISSLCGLVQKAEYAGFLKIHPQHDQVMLSDLAQVTREQWLRIRGCGVVYTHCIAGILSSHGYTMGVNAS